MKRFLLQSLVFTFFTAICFIIFWLIVCSNRDKALKLPDNTNIVFFGNSHLECAVNDSIVKNSFNFARSGENMAYTYLKIKTLYKFNKQIDTIFISYDNLVMSDSTYIDNMASPYYYDQLKTTDILKILTNKECLYSFLSNIFHWKKFLYIIKKDIHDLSELGGYRHSTRNKFHEHLQFSNKRNVKIESYSDLNTYFLSQIIDFCNHENIKVIFLFTPQHYNYYCDKEYYKKFYTGNYSNINFYDFREMHLPDSCFGDLNHLNYKGAKVFSEFLEKEVLHKQNYPIK